MEHNNKILTAESIGSLINNTISLSTHRLSYDDGGFVTAWNKFGIEELEALVAEISDHDSWKQILTNPILLENIKNILKPFPIGDFDIDAPEDCRKACKNIIKILERFS